MDRALREIIGFDCAEDRLAATLDHTPGRTGLLIVSGGNEIRIGAHRGMARLAQRVAGAGYPVFRFDRRGVGDSTGLNRGFRDSAEDIAAAARIFRERVPVDRLIGFGNCDGATALALFHRRADLDGLVLANPWVIDDESGLPPAAAIRARYAERLSSPRHWLRVARSGINISGFIKGMAKLVAGRREGENELAGAFLTALAGSGAAVSILLAERDNTALFFDELWTRIAPRDVRARFPVHRRDTASHGFAHEGDPEWLEARVIEALSAP